jgi:hypothetical protein
MSPDREMGRWRRNVPTAVNSSRAARPERRMRGGESTRLVRREETVEKETGVG